MRCEKAGPHFLSPHTCVASSHSPSWACIFHPNSHLSHFPLHFQLSSLLAKVDNWGYDSIALDEATSGHALSVLGFVLITRTDAFRRFRLDEGRLARYVDLRV